MVEATANAYDEVLYPGFAYDQTHPDRLATLATLFGMTPAPVARCRVLELGCGDGANLLPMALELPESEFVGIDLAARPIAQGQAVIDALALQNAVLLCASVTDVTGELGQFDYIIAHGLYSWVPPFVQEKILDICRANLAPQGAAYISYNALPGWRLRRMVREMLLFHMRDPGSPRESLQQALGFINFLAEPDAEPRVYRRYLRDYQEGLRKRYEESFFHDDLAEFNEPLYFHQFMERAARAGLQYLAEADFFEMQDARFPERVREELDRLAGDDRLRREQYMDFIKGRTFRQTILCHSDVSLDREVQPERLQNLYISTMVRFASLEATADSSGPVEFRSEQGATVTTAQPLAQAAVAELSQVWPRSLSFAELLRRAQSRLGEPESDANQKEDQQSALGEILLALYQNNLVELSTRPPAFAPAASERPTASPLARLQARNSHIVTGLRHAGVKIEDALGRQLLMILDGTRDRAALVAELVDWVEARDDVKLPHGEPANDRQQIYAAISQGIEAKLTELANMGLLVK